MEKKKKVQMFAPTEGFLRDVCTHTQNYYFFFYYLKLKTKTENVEIMNRAYGHKKK